MNNHKCLIIGAKGVEDRIQSLLKDKIYTKFIEIRDSPILHLKSEPYDCILLFWKRNSNQVMNLAIRLKTDFNQIPIIGVVNQNIKLETIRKSGEIGVNRILEQKNFFSLEDVLNTTISKINSKITLNDFNIDLSSRSKLLLRALKIIEQDYITLMSTAEIAQSLDINESTLSREFSKNHMVNPKRLLLYFKVKHSIKLMRNNGLKIKQIAIYSGFTNEKRFISCFKKIYVITPGEYRSRLNQNLSRNHNLKLF